MSNNEDLDSAINASYERFHQSTLQMNIEFEQIKSTLKQTLKKLQEANTERISLREELTRLKITIPTKKEAKA